MSDAITTPPTFDEMVALIEQNFKCYVQSTKAFTEAEIEEGWQRYKTLNHLWQGEKQPSLPLLPQPILTDEDVKDREGEKRQTGPVWARCSDRLPGYETPVKWRDGNDHTHTTERKIPLIHMAKPFLTGWEWYDEGAAAGREEDAVKKEVIDFIRDIAENWDCDEDGHKYNTGCRKCSASELYYELSKQQKEK